MLRNSSKRVFQRFCTPIKDPSSRAFKSTLKTSSHYYQNITTVTESHIRRQKTYYLGLDISSSKTGYSILNENGKAIECGLIDTSHITSLQQFGLFMKENFRNISQRYTGSSSNDDEWIVGAEEFLLKFKSTSSANTIAKLANCNTLACYECANELPVTKLLKLNVRAARSFFLIKEADKSKQANKTIKKQVFNALIHLLPSTYQVRYTRNGDVHESNYDVTDSLLIALYTFVRYNVCDKNIESLLRLIQEHKDESFKNQFIELSNTMNPDETSTMNDSQKIRYIVSNYETAKDHLFTIFKKKIQKEYTSKFNINTRAKVEI
ncbi:hypothetical protein FDP41_006523 [Naegleria fowleri]|uniref:Mitochondrial resolvase Ydc2 catalytic domain-containing protein n=1 Tax=Naegleria fowleri TaxID=5763 RepID=A0A6A5BJA9_NAEFO|nr:uncharacterized protein FDP41_006523 [Naegleria fowleri]KAF0974491.1 hypothetical protein FDP41_006523 [Naegleria fowleri]CAG4716984.1 unnamed protein product [Naegleria fowleri]